MDDPEMDRIQAEVRFEGRRFIDPALCLDGSPGRVSPERSDGGGEVVVSRGGARDPMGSDVLGLALEDRLRTFAIERRSW